MISRTGLLELMAETMRSHEADQLHAIASYHDARRAATGQPVEWRAAAVEWWQHQFPAWKQTRWQAAIGEALRFECALADGAIAG